MKGERASQRFARTISAASRRGRTRGPKTDLTELVGDERLRLFTIVDVYRRPVEVRLSLAVVLDL